MRILIYSYNYHPEPIGIAPLMTELAQGLVTRGHQVRVVTGMPHYPGEEIYPEYQGKLYITEEIKAVYIQRCWLWVHPEKGLWNRVFKDGSFVSTSFVQAFKGWRPDVILLTSPPLPGCVPAALLGWLRKCPVVLNVQDILPDAAVHVGLLKNQAMIRVFEVLEKFAYRAATKISVIADGFVDNLVAKGVPPSKIVMIPNWVDINFIRPLPKEDNPFRIAHGLNGKFVVLYSGNIALTQGLETVIRAATYLRETPDIMVVVVGEKEAIEKLQQCCEEWGANNVLLLPFQPREMLPQMLSAADVGLVMQKHNVISFNMPSKIQVLLASGRAIIASVPSTGTAAKAIKTSGGGVVVPPEDPEALAAAILELYKNPETAERLGQQGRQYASENYAFEYALNKYEELFTAVTNP